MSVKRFTLSTALMLWGFMISTDDGQPAWLKIPAMIVTVWLLLVLWADANRKGTSGE